MTKLPDNVQAFIENLSNEQREGLRKELISQLKTPQVLLSKPPIDLTHVEALVSRDKQGQIDNILEDDARHFAETTFDHNLLSHDRVCLRATLEEWARVASDVNSNDATVQAKFCEHTREGRLALAQQFADLHKWWDGTSYTIHNDWLFTDESFLTVELINSNGERKEFRLRVAP